MLRPKLNSGDGAEGGKGTERTSFHDRGSAIVQSRCPARRTQAAHISLVRSWRRIGQPPSRGSASRPLGREAPWAIHPPNRQGRTKDAALQQMIQQLFGIADQRNPIAIGAADKERPVHDRVSNRNDTAVLGQQAQDRVPKAQIGAQELATRQARHRQPIPRGRAGAASPSIKNIHVRNLLRGYQIKGGEPRG